MGSDNQRSRGRPMTVDAIEAQQYFRVCVGIGTMLDCGAVVVAVMLFVLLMPGLLFQVPGSSRCIEFATFRTSGASIIIHSLLYFSFICLFLIAIRVHFYIG
ncbi:hypothetical protein VNO78_12193 [Psophocarpus tetragonolobus]|uniref:Transmembrane protein n=1 Tax=Psophocarpus tetragonolobus TaxID=3891 RepID=A0AAN9XP79_PSOTE